MSNFIAKDTINEILERVDITQVVSMYLNLKKIGKNLVGICPFHSETKPSFYVSPEKNIFHCFGCNEGGNAISFFMKKENVEFREAVKRLAELFNVPLKLSEGEEKFKEKKDKFLKINNLVADFLTNNLLKNKDALDYLAKRGISKELIKRFRIGYAINSWDGLLGFLRRNSINLIDAETLGLIIKSQKTNKFYDRFRDRVMFSIFNLYNEVIGFGGRIFEEKGDEPKYLNSPESEIYNKSLVLYGLNFAKDTIKKNDFVILVEGYMDITALHKFGFTNSVAVSGTALSKAHVDILKRYTSNIVTIFDSDEAGIKANLRAAGMFLIRSLNVSVVLLPKGEDPDSYLTKYGKEKFEEELSKRRDFFEFYINTRLQKKNTVEERMNIANELGDIINEISDPLERELIIKRMAEYFGVEEVSVIENLKQRRRTRNIKDESKTENVVDLPKKELMILKIAMLYDKYLEEVENVSYLFKSSASKRLFEAIKETYKNNKGDLNSLMCYVDEDLRRVVASVAFMKDEITDDNCKEIFSSAIFALKKNVIIARSKDLTNRIKKAEKAKNYQLLKELLEEKASILKDRF